MLVCRTTEITDLKMHFTGKKCENLIFVSLVFGGLNFIWHLVILLLWPIHSAWLNFHYDFNAGVTIMFQNGYATTVSVMRALTLMLLAEPPGFDSYFFMGVNSSVFLVMMSGCYFDLLMILHVVSMHHAPVLYSCHVPASCFWVVFLCHAPVMLLCHIPMSCPCHVSVSYSCVMPLWCFCIIFLCHAPVMFLCHMPMSCPCHVFVSYSCVMLLCHAVVQVWWILASAGIWFVYYSVITLFIYCNEFDLAAFCKRGIWDHLHVFQPCFAKLWSETCQILHCDCGVKGLKKMMSKTENRVFVDVV